MAKNPKVSIIIPAYNVEKCLSESVKSAEKQSYKNIEIIIVNDGSSDNTEKVASDLSKKYSNVEVVNQENSGPGEARNRGIVAAKGDYVLFLDADDLLFPWAIEKLVSEAISSDSDVICGDMIDSGDPQKVYKETTDEEAATKTYDSEDGYKELLYSHLRPSVHAKMYKKSLVDKIKFSSLKYAEDLEFNLSIFRVSKKISVIEKPKLEIYVLSDDSLMRSAYTAKKQEGITVLRKMQKDYQSEKDKSLKAALAAGIFLHAVGLINSINDTPGAREEYADDFREIKKMIRQSCRSVATDKNALRAQKRYALAACVSVDTMLRLMKRAANK